MIEKKDILMLLITLACLFIFIYTMQDKIKMILPKSLREGLSNPSNPDSNMIDSGGSTGFNPAQGIFDYRTINTNHSEHQYGLRDYYIKTAYNACGDYTDNNSVNIMWLKTAVQMGIRCLDFEIFADISNQPVIGITKSLNDCNLTENLGLNDPLRLELVLDFLSSTDEGGGYNKGTCSNWDDPLILHFRVKSKDPLMYVNMAKLIIKYLGSPTQGRRTPPRLLPANFGYQYSGNPSLPAKNIGAVPLPELKGKVLIFVDANICCYPEKSFDNDVNRMPDPAMRGQDKNECSDNLDNPTCPCTEDYFSWKDFKYSEDGVESNVQENIFHEIVNAASHTQMLWSMENAKFVNMADKNTLIHNKEFLCMMHPDIRSTDNVEYGDQDVRLALEYGVQFIAIPWLVSNPVSADSTASTRANNIHLLETLFNNKIHSKTDSICADVDKYPKWPPSDTVSADANSCFLKKLYDCNKCVGDDCNAVEDGEETVENNYYSCGNDFNMPFFHQESAFILKPDHLRYQAVMLTEPNPAIKTNDPTVEVPIVGVKNPNVLDADPIKTEADLLRLDIGPAYNNYKSAQGSAEQDAPVKSD
jgi:hypothetical protein